MLRLKARSFFQKINQSKKDKQYYYAAFNSSIRIEINNFLKKILKLTEESNRGTTVRMHTSDNDGLVKRLIEDNAPENLKHNQISIFQHLKFTRKYLWKDMKSRSSGYRMGIFVVMISTAFLVLLGSLSELIPLLMINLSEVQMSENDFAIQSSSISGDDVLLSTLINYTNINNKLSNITEIEGCAGRWFFPVKVGISERGNAADLQLRSVAIMLNSTHEQLIGLGRKIQLPILKEGEVWLTKSLSEILGASSGMITIILN